MSSERIADQGRTIDIEPPRRPIRRAEQILFDHDLDGGHMRNAFHTRFHVKDGWRPRDDDPQMTQMYADKPSFICDQSASSADKPFHDRRPKDRALAYLGLLTNE
jgi:hypothetical protein